MALIKRNTAYSVNNIVNTKYGIKLKCTTAGTTSTDPLILDGTSPITDGTVVWEVQEEQGGTGQGLVDYEANTSYNVGDIVIYDDKIYRCITAYISTATFDSTKWEEISASEAGTSINDWVSGTSYSVKDLVIYNDKLYQCIMANSDSTFIIINWQKIGESAFTGATSSNNGEEGIVPQPTTSDISKFLCGDGTWKSAGGSGLNVSKTLLWEGVVTSDIAESSPLPLLDNYRNYDFLEFDGDWSGNGTTVKGNENYTTILGVDSNIRYFTSGFFYASSTNVNDIYRLSFSLDFINGTSFFGDVKRFKGTSSTPTNGIVLKRIYGIKLYNPNNYSIDEQEIGTWIDGKKLYQKTFIFTTPSQANVDTATFNMGVNNIDKIIDIQGCIFDGSSGMVPLYYNESSSSYRITLWVNKTTSDVYMLVGTNYISKGGWATIKYTKT